MSRDPSLALVGDIGGTNARFAIADLQGPRPSIICSRSVRCSDHSGLAEAAQAFLAGADLSSLPGQACIAVAGPVVEGRARLTNMTWEASEAELLSLGFSGARLVNDFEALATGAAELEDKDCRFIGPAAPGVASAPVIVAGAGTGFGLAVLIRSGQGRAQVIPTEGGHVAFAPADEIEIEILRHLSHRHGRVSVERVLSGPGLQALHEAMAAIMGLPSEPNVSSELIVERARAGIDQLCVAVVERFCAIFGSVVGDAVLTVGARGGVYLAGGLTEGLADLLPCSPFRERFEAKGRLSAFVEVAPTRLIAQPHTALIGAARLAAVSAPQLDMAD